MYYDKINVKAFNTGEGRLICNICEQETTVDDSISFRGFHLICNTCAYKISALLGISFGEIVITLHRESEKILSEKNTFDLITYPADLVKSDIKMYERKG